MRIMPFLVMLIFSFSLLSCRPASEDDAGVAVIVDAGDAGFDAGLVLDAGGTVVVEDAGCAAQNVLPSTSEVEAEFAAQGLTDKMNSCASCHIPGTPTNSGFGWGPDGDTSTAGWCNAMATSISTDAQNDVLLTQAYNAMVEDHPGDNIGDPAASAALVAWWDFTTTPVLKPGNCNEPEPILDAGPVEDEDAGEDAGAIFNGEAGVPYQVRFSSAPMTVARITCTGALAGVHLIDGQGQPMNNPGPSPIYISVFTASNQPGSFWQDSSCIDREITRLQIAVGERSASFRWIAEQAGDFEIQLQPVGEGSLLGDSQVQTVTP